MKFDPSKYRKRSLEILHSMTLDEKVGQLVMFGSMKRLDREDIKNGRIGSFINVPDVHLANEFQKIACEESRLGIPLLIGHDVVHGDRTLFPVPIATSSSWDLEKIENQERLAAKEAYHEGINWAFSPMIDITREPRWGRVAEGAGEDKFYGSKVAAARVRGFQSINPDTGYPYLAACFKHFCGYGLSEAGRDYEACDISDRTLHAEYLPPYRAALEAGSITCMSSFNSLNGDPVTGSRYYLTDLLRKKWGFGGLVVSDWQSIKELSKHRVTGSDEESARRALLAGCDIDMHSDVYNTYLARLADDPEIMDAIDEAVMRVLTVKMALGLFEDPYRDEDNAKYFLLPETKKAARELSAASCVLLKNEERILPLDIAGSKILLTGPFADEKYETMGIWGGRGDPQNTVTLKDALDEAGADYEYVRGCGMTDHEEDDFESGVEAAKKSDLIIFCCGEPSHWAGEMGGRTSLEIFSVQYDYLNKLKETGKKIIAVVCTARPLALEPLDKLADSILLAWTGGNEWGHGTYDVLTGKTPVSGKLTITFPRTVGQVPIYYAKYSSGRPIAENPDKYRDCMSTPLYPFGYGLSYADISYSGLTVSKKVKRGEKVNISVNVTNSSDFATETVVQVYFEDMVSSLATADRSLCGFRKIRIGAGSTEKVSFEIPVEDFSFLDKKLEPVLENGIFRIYAGTDSTCTDHADCELV